MNPLLSATQERIPIITDKLLIDFVNGIHVNQAVLEYRRTRGFFGQLLDSISGLRSQQETLIDLNLTTGQEALRQIVTYLAHEQTTSNAALVITQKSLLETREALNRHKQTLNQQQFAINALQQNLIELIQDCKSQFEDHEKRIIRAENAIAAQRDFDQILGAWESDRTYQYLPWAVQVALLTQEIYFSAVAFYESKQRDTHFRKILIDKIYARHKDALPKSFFTLKHLLDITLQETPQSDYKLISDLLFLTPPPDVAYPPLLTSLSTAYDFTELPATPNFAAIKHHVQQHTQAPIPHTLYARELIQHIVHETANYSLACLAWSQS